jgi:ADP-ribosylglycohydrolase
MIGYLRLNVTSKTKLRSTRSARSGPEPTRRSGTAPPSIFAGRPCKGKGKRALLRSFLIAPFSARPALPKIFIDGWAIVAAGDPALAARLAGEAARVSHDGAVVEAAKICAAMEAEAFVSRDVGHLLDVGLAQIDHASPIARLPAKPGSRFG